MKKIIYIVILVPFICFFLKNALSADKSTLTISGYVRDISCIVSPDSKDIIVELMKHSSRLLNGTGSVTPLVSFKITLSQCSGSDPSVKIGFTGAMDTDNNNLLKIESNSGSASGIGIQILDSKENPIVINEKSSNISWTNLAPGQQNTLTFYARMMATKNSVTAGTVSSMATFTLEFQ